MIRRVLNSKTKTVTFAALLVAGFALLSRVLGLVRNNLLGSIFPAQDADVYLAAFRIPDLVFGILITGGITAAFLPVFSKYFRKGEKEARELTSNVLSVFLLALSVLSFILFLLAGTLVDVVVPGFSVQQKAVTVDLMRIMFLSPILLGVSAIFSSILQYFNLFFAYSLAPIFYNLGIIFGILFLSNKFGLAGIAFGVVLGALLHLLVQLPPALKHCKCFKFSFNLKHAGLRRIFKLMVPRMVGSATFHINLIVITALASTLAVGAVRVFAFSNDLYGVPLGLIGVSFAAAVFPALSRSFAGKETGEFSKQFSKTFAEVLFLVIPITAMMFLFRAHIVRLVYGTLVVGEGYFGWADTRLTAACLGVFSVSIFSSCLIPLLAKTFYAVHDTRTPVKIAVFSVGLNILLAFGCVRLLSSPNFFQQAVLGFLKLKDVSGVAVLGLPMALSVSSIVQCLLLLYFLRRKAKYLSFAFLKQGFGKIILASISMAVFVYFSLLAFGAIFNTRTVLGLSLQVILAFLVGVISYLFICFMLKSQELKNIWISISTQFNR